MNKQEECLRADYHMLALLTAPQGSSASSASSAQAAFPGMNLRGPGGPEFLSQGTNTHSCSTLGLACAPRQGTEQGTGQLPALRPERTCSLLGVAVSRDNTAMGSRGAPAPPPQKGLPEAQATRNKYQMAFLHLWRCSSGSPFQNLLYHKVTLMWSGQGRARGG